MFDPKIAALSVLLPLGLAAGLPAIAQDAGGHGAEMFGQLDADGDGALSLEELQARPDRFDAADADGDGALSRDEMMARATDRAEAGVARFFERFDADGDGQVTEAEIAEVQGERQAERRAEMAARIFERADADGDGLISVEEFEEARAQMLSRGGRGDGRGEGRGGFFGDRG